MKLGTKMDVTLDYLRITHPLTAHVWGDGGMPILFHLSDVTTQGADALLGILGWRRYKKWSGVGGWKQTARFHQVRRKV